MHAKFSFSSFSRLVKTFELIKFARNIFLQVLKTHFHQNGILLQKQSLLLAFPGFQERKLWKLSLAFFLWQQWSRILWKYLKLWWASWNNEIYEISFCSNNSKRQIRRPFLKKRRHNPWWLGGLSNRTSRDRNETCCGSVLIHCRY